MHTSTLDLAPRDKITRGAGSNAEPAWLPPYPASSAAGQAVARAARPDYADWLAHVQAAAGCTRPVRLAGTLTTVEAATGRILDSRHTDALPDAVIYKACGNRRHAVCPSCARTYQRDAYQLLRAGLVGGKGVPATVSTHPAVFITLTAPGFGTVHTRHIGRHTCTDRKRCDCRPDPCHARRDTPGPCPHGQPAVCWSRHTGDDPQLGQPLCADCYDHDHHVVFNAFAAELWHRTKQHAERALGKLCRGRGIPPVPITSTGGKSRLVPPVRLSHGKAAEMQRRGVIHFHVLVRLDGVHPDDPAAVVPPPSGVNLGELVDALNAAARQVTFTTPSHLDRPDGWSMAWGEQIDIRPITLTGAGEITDGMAAGYLAKYATKSTEATGHTSTRLTADTIDQHADPDGEHTARLIDACWRLGRPTGPPAPLGRRPQHRPVRPAAGRSPERICRRPEDLAHTRHSDRPFHAGERQPRLDTKLAIASRLANPYARLRRWAHMLGYGGHFLTKARRYSITFRLLRDTRIAFRRGENQAVTDPGLVRAADHLGEETTLIVGTLTFAGVGWHTSGDAFLANTAAALARARHDTGRDELAHEAGSTMARTLQAA
jgi:hypothetical protein